MPEGRTAAAKAARTAATTNAPDVSGLCPNRRWPELVSSLYHLWEACDPGFTDTRIGAGKSAPKSVYAMGLDSPNASPLFRDDLHRAAFGGGIALSREVAALGAHVGGNDATLKATIKAKGIEWLEQYLLHVAATDILGYLVCHGEFLEFQQTLRRKTHVMEE